MNTVSTTNAYLRVAAALLLFSLLMMARESNRFGFIFEFLPVLGGSIPYFLLTICFILIYRATGHKLRDIGLKTPLRETQKLRSAMTFLGWILGVIFASMITGSVVVEVFTLLETDTVETIARKSVLVGNLPLLLILTPLMWLAVLGEELLFRGLIMNFLANHFGDTPTGWFIAIILTAFLFGIAHYWQGPRGIVGAGMLGLIWGFAYYFSGKNLWPATIAHCVTNTIGFISTYQS